MTVKELAGFIGKEGYINHGYLHINIKIVDIKKEYGRIRYQVSPISGSGEEWLEGVKFEEE